MDDIMQRFLAYANDFERTLVDDDWSRLRQYFADDAVYDVKAGSFGGTMHGPTQIFAGMKKSLDGLDRRFDKREIQVVEAPAVAGDELTVGWIASYHMQGHPPLALHGRTRVRYAAGKIARLEDSFDEATDRGFSEWKRATGLDIDPSYV